MLSKLIADLLIQCPSMAGTYLTPWFQYFMGKSIASSTVGLYQPPSAGYRAGRFHAPLIIGTSSRAIDFVIVTERKLGSNVQKA
ncbi:hypothetical protein BaRGS_00019332 [Batillaria attramentaria]|uniref:Uncharacterized protein n=1 Tax=Batillaria attramentaria TaxID=370345 RepID=A0ABD0KR50_9CAEN